MGKLLAKLVEQLRDFYQNLSPMKRTSVMTATFIILIALGIVFMMLTGRNYTPLLTNVPVDAMPQVIAKLTEKQIPYSITDNGKVISVPPEFLHSTQMMLMSETGLAKIGDIGFELFDKETFGTSSFAQKVNYQRALQGELSRVIASLEEVKNAKVMIALPPKKTFLEEGESPSASVVIELRDSKSLNVDQVRGIIHLVSSAVEGMEAERVTVVDSRGKVLSRNVAGMAAQSNEMMEYKLKQQQQLEDRIEEILSKVVGSGKVTAKVNADVNFRQVSSVEEIVDPDKQAIKAIQVEEEKLRGNRQSAAGVPGARANLPGAEEPGSVGFRQDVDKELKTTNYDNTKTTRTIKEPIGGISKLSVAVLVDGVTETITGEDGKVTEKYTPRSAEELARYEAIVKSAIGFDEKRGDTVKIENFQFQREDFSDADRLITSLERQKLIAYSLRWGIIALSFGLFIWFVVRPFMRWISFSFQESVEEVLPKTIEELEEMQGADNTLPGLGGALPVLEETIDPDKAESELLKERIVALVQTDTKKASFALSQWIDERRAS